MRTAVSRCIALCAMLLFSAAAFAVVFSNQYQTIASWDGTKLGALVLVPQGQSHGPFPLVVMSASWSVPNLEYVGRARELASDGYVVISYTSRGF